MLVLGIGILMAIGSTVTDEQREKIAVEREEERFEREELELQKEIKRLEERDAKKMAELIKQKQAESQEAKLDATELQTIIAGFESYNKSVKMLLDMCGSVESETDFRLLMVIIAETGDDFLENTGNYGAVRNKLMAEGYGEHSVLGPLMDRSVFLVDIMSTCMGMLAWEFSG